LRPFALRAGEEVKLEQIFQTPARDPSSQDKNAGAASSNYSRAMTPA